MIAGNSTSTSTSSTSTRSSSINGSNKTHLTVRLVLELLAVDCCASQRPGASLRRPARGTDAALTSAAAGEVHEEPLRAALHRCLLAASRLDWGGSMHPAMATTTSRHDSSCCDEQSIGSAGSWEEEQWEEEDCFEEDRGRLGASARSRDLSLDEDRLSALADHREECCGGGSATAAAAAAAAAAACRESSALGEVEDCRPLAGVVAAIYGYKASGGDLVFLEKAYDLARGVAASKQDLAVAFNACRVALAVGYVYTLKSVSLDGARTFALHHSLPKLALSLKPYWSRGTTELNKQANELKWQECMLSLLEVGSSVSMLANAEDVFCALDADIQAGVIEAIGLYCVLNPSALSQYQDVGRACKERYLSILAFDQSEHTATKFRFSNSSSNNIPAVTEQNWFVDSE